MNILTNIFKILSDDTRLRILMLLYQEDLCVCEISGVLDVPQSKISKNLSKLRDLNFVTAKRKERFIYYSLIRENEFLLETLKNIFMVLKQYPQLITDKKMLNKKEKFITI